MIKMPETKLKVLIDAFLDRLENDYESNTDKSLTVLNRLYDGLVIDNYAFLDQAIEIFINRRNDPKRLDTRLFLDRDRATLPTLHITFPSEEPIGDGIGFDEGYLGNVAVGTDQFYERRNRGYSSKFYIMITGASTFEVLLIFYTVKILLLNNLETLEHNGFRNPRVYGQELRLNEEILPTPYVKAIVLDSFFDLEVPRFGSIDIINSVNFNGEAYEQ